ncbi:hypothetical protein IWX49DRAFT_158998 [Phyllosticta citricarpa]|uniref:Uncharacterized protein n=2 Tax=Phyllosticta TaxID=121621 RepID=A0ABR1M6J2_9PEZI
MRHRDRNRRRRRHRCRWTLTLAFLEIFARSSHRPPLAREARHLEFHDSRCPDRAFRPFDMPHDVLTSSAQDSDWVGWLAGGGPSCAVDVGGPSFARQGVAGVLQLSQTSLLVISSFMDPPDNRKAHRMQHRRSTNPVSARSNQTPPALHPALQRETADQSRASLSSARPFCPRDLFCPPRPRQAKPHACFPWEAGRREKRPCRRFTFSAFPVPQVFVVSRLSLFRFCVSTAA